MSLCLKKTVSALLLITPLATLALERTELLPQGETSVRITQSGQLWNDFDEAFGYGAMDHRTAPAVMYIRVSDSTFKAGFGLHVGKPTDGKELGENEISLDHLTSFLHNTHHFAEAVPNGIHHRIVFENHKNQGAR